MLIQYLKVGNFFGTVNFAEEIFANWNQNSKFCDLYKVPTYFICLYREMKIFAEFIFANEHFL